MDRRVITLGLGIAIIASIISQLLFRGQKLIVEFVLTNTQTFLQPFFKILTDAAAILPWVIPGFYVGYLCTRKPVQHGAITGALYGAILGLTFSLIRGPNLYDTDSKIMLIVFAATYIIKYSFLFALTSPAGYLFAKQRTNL